MLRNTIEIVKNMCYTLIVKVLRNTNKFNHEKGWNIMKKKKLVSLLTVCAMTASLLAGCGNGANNSGSGDSGKSGSSTAKSDKVELELFSTKTENMQTLQTLVDEFTSQHDNISIEITAPADAGTVLKTRLTKNDLPDIIACGGDATYTELQSAGMLMDMSDEVGNIQEAYMQMLYDVNKDGESVAYGVPYATNASGILYNKDMFEELGISIPQTWDELMTACETIKAAGKTPFELTFADNWTCLPPWNSMAPVIPDASFTADRKENKTTFEETHQEVLEKYAKILEYAQNDYMGTTYADGNKLFAEGQAAMMINGNWAISEFKNTNADFNVDMFAFPSVNDAERNTVTSGIDVLFAVSSESDSAQQEAAKEFIRFMTETDHAQQYITEQFAFSAVEGVAQEDPTVASVKQDIADGRVSNFPDHYYPSGFDLASILSQFALNVTNGMDLQENITQTLQTCDEQYDATNVD